MTRYTMNFPAKSWRGDLVAGIVLGAVWGGSAHAQTPPSETAKGLTAMRLEELLDVRFSPFNVSRNLDNGDRAQTSDQRPRFCQPSTGSPFPMVRLTYA